MNEYIGIVKTKYGLVSGEEQEGQYEGITLFKGIPFAAPPVGELRWKPPVDPAPWEGVRECTKYGPICIQPTNGDLDAEPWATDFYYMGSPEMSEDCLYLNVATGAAKAGEKRPVYMWFHGGGNDHGYSYEIEFDPRELAKRGVIVVSVAQRLSLFGYMTLPQLDAEQEGRSGNYILMDDMKALEWVIDNIAAFGGDPNCITVGGQSAGTGKSSTLAFTTLAKGHIKRVINESGLNWNRKTAVAREDAQAACAEYLRKIGIDPELPLDELRKIDPYKFLPGKQKVRIFGTLVYDGDLIGEATGEESMDKYGADYDYLAGTNLGETHMLAGRARGQRGFETAADFYAYVREMIGDLYDKYDFESIVKVTDENVDRESRRLASYGLYKGDRMGGLMLNRTFGEYRAQTAPEKKTYNYLFSRVSPVRAEDYGTSRDPAGLMSWHSNELWYAFASLRPGTPPARPWEDTDYKLADTMCSYWANFIKTGDPNAEGLPLWPATDKGKGFVELGDEIVPHTQWGPIDELIREFLNRNEALPKK